MLNEKELYEFTNMTWNELVKLVSDKVGFPVTLDDFNAKSHIFTWSAPFKDSVFEAQSSCSGKFDLDDVCRLYAVKFLWADLYEEDSNTERFLSIVANEHKRSAAKERLAAQQNPDTSQLLMVDFSQLDSSIMAYPAAHYAFENGDSHFKIGDTMYIDSNSDAMVHFLFLVNLFSK